MPHPLPTPEEMRRWDQLTIEEFGLSGAVLMENASRAALAALEAHAGPVRGKRVVVFAGAGNNAGDGFALARHLINLGAQVLVLHAKPLESYTADAGYHLQLLRRMDAALEYLPEYEADFLHGAHIVVDALLGTGFQGPLRPEYSRWIATINRLGQRALVLALDIPSGLCGHTGEPQPVAVQATVTITFEEPKLGLVLPPAQPFVGTLEVGKIGIPRHIKEAHPTTHIALGPEVWEHVPTPTAAMHKGIAGHVLVVGGSPGLTGAPLLAARAAYRAGAGLVTWAAPEGLLSQGAPFPETMTMSLGPAWGREAATRLHDNAHRFDSVILGPGLGRSAEAAALVAAYLKAPHPRLVLDADALFHLAQDRSLLECIPQDAVLTPHPGEMARLLATSAEAINAKRLEHARAWVTAHPSHLVLKGAGTIVASPNAPMAVSPWCAPNLAVAGSGDVLAGVLGALLAWGVPPHQAACAAVYWHGKAGDALRHHFPFRGNTPLDIAETLPHVRKE
ncbi:bifunctional NAD(P)H-hydrate repair enzyme Nnr [Thermodesulfomicrobium sp. WS]|uniref:NAD(P)H-hydrate dehydratase n=1 Tax=Thermodesulfomicrobium sp. WS TaxID=3004129 RepID=UPI0024936FEA|nr:NAD(P)H-hydrate dehydratase [Thermodesulfomicrobium sp. WS]BDV01623.1 bifunctional NAD(P)H-hydrate repair enzyme Nnr [Thermodesulfomicrobium sp. WS]